MADNETPESPETPEKPSMVKKLLLPAGMAVVLVAVIMAGLHFTGMVSFGTPPATAAAEGGDAAPPVEMATGPSFYAALRPAMVVQFNSKGKRHFLKVAVDIMSHKQPTIEAFRMHDAVIRNNLILMFQDLDFDAASTRIGIEALQADAEREIEDILEPFTGDRTIEGVYFTTFVLQ